MVLITALSSSQETNAEYLRIHIRANSNSYADQSVKYEIKSEVVNYLTPFIASINTKEEAVSVLERESENVTNLVNKILCGSGLNYTAKTHIRNELFPTRVYDDLTLEEGFYDAVIIELGEASGDNWWCVIYPPLCFQGTEKLTYKSKIAEIIKNFKARYIKEKV